jgi:hypothetical protein
MRETAGVSAKPVKWLTTPDLPRYWIVLEKQTAAVI